MTIHKIIENQFYDEWDVLSHSSYISYIVSFDKQEDSWWCSCPHFLYRLSKKEGKYVPVHTKDTSRQCKHIKEIIETYQKKGSAKQ